MSDLPNLNARSEPKYLCKAYYDNGDFSVSLHNAAWIIKTTNEMDFNGIEKLRVFDLTNLDHGNIEELFYVGWQRGCKIDYINEAGNLVISGYGEDH